MKAILKKIVIRLITFEARLVLKKYKPQIIAVTGSVGKTSVKDAIYTALIPSLFIRKNEKSLNGEIGTPLTILGADSGWGDPFSWARILFEGALLIILKNRYPKWLVLEVGTDHPGEIRGITRWLKPDVTVITALPEVPVHVEFFESTEALIREKRYLADALKENGTLILCGDDRKAAALKSVYDVRSILYGFGPPSDIRAEHAEIMYDENGAPLGMQFDVCHGGGAVPMALTGTLGKQQVYPLLAAHAVAEAIGVDARSARKALDFHDGPKGRMRLIVGVNGSMIIDDSYNSSPVALAAALDTLREVKAQGRKIAVLGDMLELGRFSAEAHRAAGEQAAGVLDRLITVGIRARGLAEAARDAGLPASAITAFESDGAYEAGKKLHEMLQPGDIVLVKGSQSGIRLERTVKEIMAEPERAGEMLVRQEPEWLARS